MLYTCEGTPRRGIGILQSLHLIKILSLCEFSRFFSSAAELSAILGHDSASQGNFFSETSTFWKREHYAVWKRREPITQWRGPVPQKEVDLPVPHVPVFTSDGSYHEPLDLVQNK